MAGAIAGIAGLAASAGTGLALGAGGAAFVVCLIGFALLARHAIASAQRTYVVRFPS